jgi:hypothetical protein
MVRYFRRNRETGEVLEITQEGALRRLQGYYKLPEQTLKNSSLENKLTTGAADYWVEN